MMALYRPTPADDWTDCEILGTDGLNYIVREVGKVWPGVAITPHVRVPAGEIFEPEILKREGGLPRNPAPRPHGWTARRLRGPLSEWKWRVLRESVGREAAAQAVLAEQTAGEST